MFPLFRFHTVDMSVAVATDTGLITPIVFQADKKVCIIPVLQQKFIAIQI